MPELYFLKLQIMIYIYRYKVFRNIEFSRSVFLIVYPLININIIRVYELLGQKIHEAMQCM